MDIDEVLALAKRTRRNHGNNLAVFPPRSIVFVSPGWRGGEKICRGGGGGILRGILMERSSFQGGGGQIQTDSLCPSADKSGKSSTKS